MGIKSHLLCADACGLGKTLIGIETAHHIQEYHPHPIIVVCKKSAKLQWEYAIREQVSNANIKRLDTTKNFDEVIEEGNPSHSLDWYIIHFAALRKLTKKDMLARTYFSTIIVDEAHRIKNKRAQQTVGVKKLLGYRRIALTATEMESSPADMWSLLNFLRPGKYGGYHGWCAKYVEYEIHPYFKWKKVIGPKNLKKMAKELTGTYLKRTKEEVRPDLPPLREQRVPIEPNPALQSAYTQIETAGDIIVDVDDMELIIPNVLAKIMTLRQMTSNGYNTYTSDKMDYALSYVADNPDANVVIFSYFRETAKAIAKKLKAPLVIGAQEAPDIQKLKPNLLVGTIGALGESHDLPWMDVAIFVDVDWSSTAMQQAKDRIHRINITSPKLVLYLYHPDTVDDLIFEALDKKWSDIELVQSYLRRMT
jgi:SNF2 family DNA or RNA helicase